MQLQNSSNLAKKEKLEAAHCELDNNCKRLKRKYLSDGEELRRAKSELEWADGKWEVPNKVMERAAEQCKEPTRLAEVRAKLESLRSLRSGMFGELY